MTAVRVDAAAWAGFRPAPTLVRARLRMLRNGALRGSAEQRVLALVVVLVALFAGLLLGRITAFSLDVAAPAPSAVEAIVAGLLGALAGFTLISAVPFALSALFVARDLEGLHVTPLRPRALLLARLCDQLATGLGVGALLAGPPLAVYLARSGELLWLPFIGLVALAMAAIPLAAGSALTIAAVRLLPARRVKDAGAALVSLAMVAVTAVNLLLRGPEGVAQTPAALDPARGATAAASVWLPTGWAARSCLAAMHGQAATALLWALPVLAGGPLALLALARGGERAYVAGFLRGQEASGGRRRRAGGALRGSGRRPAWLVVAVKDSRLLRRDPAQLGQLLLPLALFAVYIASPGQGSTAGTRLPPWFGIALTATFAGLFAASGLALRSVGAEGPRLAVLRASPAPARAVLLGKALTGAAVSIAAAWLLLGIAAARGRLEPAALPPAALRSGVALLGLSALAVGIGTVRPRLDWTDPRRAIGLGTSLGFLLAGSVYIAVVFSAWALPYAAGAAVPAGLADLAAGLLICAVGAGALAAGTARLRRIEV